MDIGHEGAVVVLLCTSSSIHHGCTVGDSAAFSVVVVVSGHARALRAGCDSSFFETPFVVVVYGPARARGGGKMLLVATR